MNAKCQLANWVVNHVKKLVWCMWEVYWNMGKCPKMLKMCFTNLFILAFVYLIDI